MQIAYNISNYSVISSTKAEVAILPVLFKSIGKENINKPDPIWVDALLKQSKIEYINAPNFLTHEEILLMRQDNFDAMAKGEHIDLPQISANHSNSICYWPIVIRGDKEAIQSFYRETIEIPGAFPTSFKQPQAAVFTAMVHIRLILLIKALGLRYNYNLRWYINRIRLKIIRIGVSDGKDNHLIDLPYSSYWENISIVTTQMEEFFQEESKIFMAENLLVEKEKN